MKEKVMRVHSVKYNFIMNVMLTVSTYVYSLVTFPYVSRILAAEGNGKVSFVTSIANYFMLIASLGIPTYGIRACAKVRDDKEKLSQVAHEVFFINLIATLISILIYSILVLNVPRFYAEKELFIINGFNIILNCFGINWFYQAIEQYDYITLRSLIFKVISVVLVFVLVKDSSDYIVYGAITVFATVGSNIINFIRSHRYIQFRYMGGYTFSWHLKPIFVLFALSLASSIYNNLDNIMLGLMQSNVEVGYYNAAVKIKNMLGALVISLGTVLLPRMTYYIENNKIDMFMIAIKKAISFIITISLPMFCYFVVYAHECIELFAGSGYEPAVSAMQFILVCIILIGLSNLIGVQVLTPLGREKYVLYSAIVGAVIDLLFNLIMIPKMGASGAALATVFAELGVLLTQIYFARDYLKGNVDYMSIAKHVFVCVISMVFVIVMKQIMNFNVFGKLVISCVVFCGIYLGGLVLIKDYFVISLIGKLRKFI